MGKHVLDVRCSDWSKIESPSTSFVVVLRFVFIHFKILFI